MKFTDLTFRRKRWRAGAKYKDDAVTGHYVQASKNKHTGEVSGLSGLFRQWISKVDANGDYQHDPRTGRVIGEDVWVGTGAIETWADFLASQKKAQEWRQLARNGVDLRQHKRQLRAASVTENKPVKTFDQCWVSYVEKHRHGWRSEKHAAEWEHSRRIIEPAIGSMDIATVTRHDFRRAVADIWCSTAVTASRTLGRMVAVHDFAIANGDVPEDSRISLELTRRSLGSQGVRQVRHLAALPYQDIPALARLLRGCTDVASQALLFCALNASRSGEVLGMRWNEISKDTWTVPADRMKGHREHRVPLSPAALDVLNRMKARRRKPDGIVFPGRYHGQLSPTVMRDALRRAGVTGATVHGFRSAFSDWAAEVAHAEPWLVEVCLAHASGDKVRDAYTRSDILNRRAKLMSAWGDYVLPAGELISLEDRRKTA